MSLDVLFNRAKRVGREPSAARGAFASASERLT